MKKNEKRVKCPGCGKPGIKRSRVQIKDGSYNRVYQHLPDRKLPRHMQISQYCIVNEPDMTVTEHEPLFSVMRTKRRSDPRFYTCRVCQLNYSATKREHAVEYHKKDIASRAAERQEWLRKMKEEEEYRVRNNVSILEDK